VRTYTRVHTNIYIGVISLYIDTRAKRNAAADRRADFCLGFTISIYIYIFHGGVGGTGAAVPIPTYLPTFVFLSTSPAVTFVCFYPRLIYNKSSNRVGFIISRVPLAPKLYIYMYVYWVYWINFRLSPVSFPTDLYTIYIGIWIIDGIYTRST